MGSHAYIKVSIFYPRKEIKITYWELVCYSWVFLNTTYWDSNFVTTWAYISSIIQNYIFSSTYKYFVTIDPWWWITLGQNLSICATTMQLIICALIGVNVDFHTVIIYGIHTSKSSPWFILRALPQKLLGIFFSELDLLARIF